MRAAPRAMQRALDLAPGFAAAALIATVAEQQIRYHRELQHDIHDPATLRIEAELPSTSEAQATRVVRVRNLLSDDELASVHALASDSRLGIEEKRKGWRTTYLSTDGAFARELPALKAKLIAAARDVDARERWNLLGTRDYVPRVVEYHVVEPGGSLPHVDHYDAGSLVTIDVMLSDASDFEGAAFQTLEADGTLRPHAFDRGDAVIFQSHKPHCVSELRAGQRRVLVMELWEGEERQCAHRCEKHHGPCAYSARTSFWARALAGMADDA